MIVVVDTNVAVVANEDSKQASSACVLTCMRRLRLVTTDIDTLAIDDRRRIVREYQANLRSVGQPGVGDAFLKWVLTNLANSERCEQVVITPIGDSETDFQEFPSDPALQNFDHSDRKFVAVALAHARRPAILQAVDTDWWKARDALARNGVNVDFLCPDDLERLQLGKVKRRRQRRKRV